MPMNKSKTLRSPALKKKKTSSTLPNQASPKLKETQTLVWSYFLSFQIKSPNHCPTEPSLGNAGILERFQPCHSLVWGTWASYLTSLGLSFLIYKMELIYAYIRDFTEY